MTFEWTILILMFVVHTGFRILLLEHVANMNGYDVYSIKFSCCRVSKMERRQV